MGQPCHTIKVAAKLTGLSTHVIRVWEKRYGVVTPNRTTSRRRLFSESELERLTWLRQATDAGYSIGSIANLPDRELKDLVKRAEAFNARPTPQFEPGDDRLASSAAPELSSFLQAIKNLDGQALEQALSNHSVRLGAHGLLVKVVAPLARSIGEQWEGGEMTAAHEHFASAVIRDFLLRPNRIYGGSDSAPVLVVATPSGQLHELGAVIVANAAANHGWKVLYLGPSLPAADIAGAAVRHHSRAVALSIVYPADDPHLSEELANLRKLLPPEIKILVGGRSADAYRGAVRKIGATQLEDLPGLFQALGEMRTLKPQW